MPEEFFQLADTSLLTHRTLCRWKFSITERFERNCPSVHSDTVSESRTVLRDFRGSAVRGIRPKIEQNLLMQMPDTVRD